MCHDSLKSTSSVPLPRRLCYVLMRVPHVVPGVMGLRLCARVCADGRANGRVFVIECMRMDVRHPSRTKQDWGNMNGSGTTTG